VGAKTHLHYAMYLDWYYFVIPFLFYFFASSLKKERKKERKKESGVLGIKSSIILYNVPFV